MEEVRDVASPEWLTGDNNDRIWRDEMRLRRNKKRMSRKDTAIILFYCCCGCCQMKRGCRWEKWNVNVHSNRASVTVRDPFTYHFRVYNYTVVDGFYIRLRYFSLGIFLWDDMLRWW